MKRAYTFIVFAGILTLTGCAWRNEVSTKVLDVNQSTKDEDIRGKLLSYTPKGSDGTNVLKFVVDDLRPKEGCTTYFAYFETCRKARPDWEGKLIVCVDLSPPSSREIFADIGAYRDFKDFYTIRAYWEFDKKDKLVDIVVGRDHTP